MRIVICDAHRVFAEALASLLRTAGHDIVGCAVVLAEAARLVAREQVDACVIDLGATVLDQAGGLDEVVTGAPRTAFVVVTARADAASLGRALAAGVRGVALKDDDFVEIHRVLTVAVHGGAASRRASTAVLSLSARAAMRPGGRRERDGAEFLTPREREALVRLVRGESTTVMARSMGVRKTTARTHVDAVLTKLGAHSRLEAVAYAVRMGIVDVDAPLELQNSVDGSRAVSG